MRLIRFGMGFVAVLIAFAVFAFTSSVHDDLKPLRPYISSETISYYTEQAPGAKPMFIVSRAMKLDGRLTVGQAMQIAMSAPRGTHGFSYRTDPPVFRTPALSNAYGMNLKAPVFEITYWRQLKWNEVLWVRFTHIGRDAFPRQPQMVF